MTDGRTGGQTDGSSVVRFFGVRGSIATPGPGTVRYGGNTSCALVQVGDERLILDAGTGLRVLGVALRDESSRPPVLDADLLLTHAHWDHIQGLPYFHPLYDSRSRVRIHGPRQASGLQGVLERQMAWETFPIPPSAQGGIESVNELDPGQFTVGGWRVGAFGLCHAGHTLGYRIERNDAQSLAYVTDNELAGGSHGKGPGWRNGLVDFLQGTHTLVHDTTWADERLPDVAGWGHSSPSQAVDLARDAGVKRLVLFHHHPEYDDLMMDHLLSGARGRARDAAKDLEVIAAIEGDSLSLDVRS